MLHAIRLLRKFCCQACARRRLLIEAALYLLMARLGLAVLSFRQLTWFLNRSLPQAEITGSEREQLRQEVSWAIDTVATYLPGETLCFPRGIAAQAMLRRRRVRTTLYYGVAKVPGGGLTAHVWVQDGAQGVVGHRIASQYTVLMRYPEVP
jgi:hypothetical protein